MVKYSIFITKEVAFFRHFESPNWEACLVQRVVGGISVDRKDRTMSLSEKEKKHTINDIHIEFQLLGELRYYNTINFDCMACTDIRVISVYDCFR